VKEVESIFHLYKRHDGIIFHTRREKPSNFLWFPSVHCAPKHMACTENQIFLPFIKIAGSFHRKAASNGK
jgi:hypothetical protein